MISCRNGSQGLPVMALIFELCCTCEDKTEVVVLTVPHELSEPA
jgi:hypothetical protein